MIDCKKDRRFCDIEPFKDRIWLSSPTMHGEELKYMQEAYDTNWMSTIGENIDEIERQIAEKVGCKHSVALASGTSAIHLAVKHAAERIYGRHRACEGALMGHKVFCSDVTFAATVNPVAYENGEAVFIDSEYDTWNMDPEALEKAFDLYPDVKMVVLAHLYGTPSKIDEIRAVCDAHRAILIEDAAESFGATYKGVQTGSFGEYNCISFNGNKVITGTSGGMVLTNDEEAAKTIRKWSTQSRENAAWYQHENIGYNYRMSNVIAGVVRGQLSHIDEHIAQKRDIYMRYKEGLRDIPLMMNPYEEGCAEPNFWLSCILIDKDAMCETYRGEMDAMYSHTYGRSCPAEILEAILAFNAEARPIWKPMHMQPIYKNHDFVSIVPEGTKSVGEDIFERGLCLASDNKMTQEQQHKIIKIIKRCFE